jgi:hypothetical protein
VLQVGGNLDLRQEPLGADHRGQLGLQNLHCHLAIVLEILREVDRSHAALTQLALDRVAVGEGGGETGAHRSTSITHTSLCCSSMTKKK